MTMSHDKLLLAAFLYAIVGTGLEVVQTAILDYMDKKDLRLMGHASVLYIPFYAVFPLAYFILFHETLFAWPFYVRGAAYVVSFWVVEYFSMGLLRLIFGKSPSEDTYKRSRWNVHGLIRLDYGHFWLCFGFIFEWMFRRLSGL